MGQKFVGHAAKFFSPVPCIFFGFPKPTSLPLAFQKTKNYNTLYSHVVPHHSTDKAITGLTAEIRRDPVLFRLYGRSSLADPF
jgi:hypothetical protein